MRISWGEAVAANRKRPDGRKSNEAADVEPSGRGSAKYYQDCIWRKSEGQRAPSILLEWPGGFPYLGLG
jgi:hypothetical protein